jgi:hypothetical protein
MLIPPKLAAKMLKDARVQKEARLLQDAAELEVRRGEFIGLCKYCKSPIYEYNLRVSPCCAGMYPE